jgi:hypothetical protein
MATSVIHIGRKSWLTGRVRTLCRQTLAPGEGAAPGSPWCRRCVRRQRRINRRTAR